MFNSQTHISANKKLVVNFLNLCKAAALVCFTGNFLLGQSNRIDDKPVVSSGDIQFYLDHTSFMGKEGKEYVEFYLMVFADQLNIESNKVEFAVTSELTDAGRNKISNNEWVTQAEVISDSLSLEKVIYDQWNQELNPGQYILLVTIKDKQSGKEGSAEYPVLISQSTAGKLSISQIQFASRIDQVKSTSHFTKGNKSVIPNPSRRFGILNPVLYLYYELYNPSSAEKGKLGITYSVIDHTGKSIKTYPPVEGVNISATSAFTHGLNTANIPSGIYDMKVEIVDSLSGEKAVATRRFEIIQKDFTDLQPALTVEDAAVFEKLLNIIGSPNEIKVFSQLEMNAKAKFILQYWKEQDPTPGTPENEYLEKIQDRFRFAEENFSWGENRGWESERGRVLIKYGMPENIERHYSEASTVPYEIWQYTREKSFYFVFGDLRSNGRFVLLHSNLEGEISNETWQEYIRRM